MIYFYYGADQFRLHEAVTALKEKLVQKNATVAERDFSEKLWSADDLASACGAQGLFSEPRLVLIRELIGSTKAPDQKSLLAFIKKHGKTYAEDKELTLVFVESTQPRKNSTVLKTLTALANETAEFAPLPEQHRPKWIMDHCKNAYAPATIKPDAANLLALSVGDDLYRADRELAKLAAYVGKEEITKDIVSELTTRSQDAQIFATMDAVTSGNKALALQKCREQLEAGDDPFYLFSMYLRHFRILLQVADCQERRIFQQQVIASQLKLHPFVVQKAMAQANRYPVKKLKAIYGMLRRMDESVKTGKIPMDVAIERMIVAV